MNSYEVTRNKTEMERRGLGPARGILNALLVVALGAVIIVTLACIAAGLRGRW